MRRRAGGGNARRERRHEPRDRGAVGREALAFRRGKRRLLPPDQAQQEERLPHDEQDRAQAARQQRHAQRQEHVPQVERVSHAAIRSVGHQTFRAHHGVVHDLAAQVSRRPAPDRGRRDG